ncbi:hypothetical protein Clacol_003329 [Clathrus columnatus]|uniref:Uncharacterized protein n=1 Tax=Clathrus columnatus TaxID=1419009 RepID=A0AAV5A3A7_9AGAM|nr:hypothetical protein Clacol_003329 [Clathrus columnatus]
MQTQASTTLGWDVVVNYGETELNRLLAIAYDKDSTGNKSIKEFECPCAVSLYQFLEEYAEIVDTTTPSQSIGEKVYTIILNNLVLATAKGGVTNDEVSSENPTPSETPFVFPPNSDASGVVFIDFEASSSDLTECPLNSEDPGCAGRSPLVDNHLGDLKDIIRSQFLTKYKHIIYELARTNNSKPVEGIKLVPKSFMFATHKPDEGETILSLFIQTGDTNNGLQSRLNSNWDTLWGTTLACPPIPSGKTASVILAKNTIFTSMIEPGLKNQGYSGELDNTTRSLQIQIDTKKEIHEPEDKKSSMYSSTTYHTAINVVLPKLQLVLEQNPSDKPAYCRGSWSYKYKFSWDEYSALGDGSDRNGSVTVENTLDEDTYPVKLENEYTLEVNFKIRKEKWKVTATPDSQSFWDIINGGSTKVPSWTKDLNVFLPEMNIDMGSLDFFLTTNLLLPSREVIDIDTKLGVQVPGDFYLVGSVENSRK